MNDDERLNELVGFDRGQTIPIFESVFSSIDVDCRSISRRIYEINILRNPCGNRQ